MSASNYIIKINQMLFNYLIYIEKWPDEIGFPRMVSPRMFGPRVRWCGCRINLYSRVWQPLEVRASLEERRIRQALPARAALGALRGPRFTLLQRRAQSFDCDGLCDEATIPRPIRKGPRDRIDQNRSSWVSMYFNALTNVDRRIEAYWVPGGVVKRLYFIRVGLVRSGPTPGSQFGLEMLCYNIFYIDTT